MELFLDSAFDAEGGTKTMKLSSISELYKIKEKFDLCDIFRLRNPNKRRFLFRLSTRTNSKIQRRLDFFFISSSLQEIVIDSSILVSCASNHSPVYLKFSKNIPFFKARVTGNSTLVFLILVTSVSD